MTATTIDRSYVLPLAFATTVSMWAVAYFCRLPVVMAPSWLAAGLMLGMVALWGWVTGSRAGGGWLGGLFVGGVAAVLNLLILGSLLTPAEGGTLYDALGAANTAVANHVAAGDPHTQYLTQAEGGALYDPIGAASAAVVAHVAEGNPHAQYLSTATGDARYLSLAGGTTTGPIAVPAGATAGQVPQRQEVDSAIGTSIANHVAAGDPHPQYTTDAEATAIANAAVSTHVAQPDPHPQYATSATATDIAIAFAIALG